MSIIETSLFDESMHGLESRIRALNTVSNTKILSTGIYIGTYQGKLGYWANLTYVIINARREMRKYTTK